MKILKNIDINNVDIGRTIKGQWIRKPIELGRTHQRVFYGEKEKVEEEEEEEEKIEKLQQ